MQRYYGFVKNNFDVNALTDPATASAANSHGVASLFGLSHDQCYSAFLSHDTRFDGRLFVAVRTTKIYCRPICRVKPPKASNCIFFAHMAQAEMHGYRPCLRCRPELSPGYSETQAISRLAYACATALQHPSSASPSLESLAASFGVTARHLRRTFNNEFGVSPIQYAQTQKLLLAKRLLTDTDLAVTTISYAAGFKSLRRMNTLFKEQYRLAPSRLRKAVPLQVKQKLLTVMLSYRPPYAWAEQLRYLQARTLTGIEYVSLDTGEANGEKNAEPNGARYWRSVLISQAQGESAIAGWIGVRHVPNRLALEVVMSHSLSTVIGDVLILVRRLFDIDARPADIREVLSKANHDGVAFDFAPLLEREPGLRLAGAFDGYEMAMRAILGQLVSVKAAHATASKLVLACGEKLADYPNVEPCPCPLITHFSPRPQAMLLQSQEQLGQLGLTRQKQTALKALASAMIDGSIVLNPGVNVQATIEKLKALPGIGDWTAQYIAMRALAWPDAFPATDYGVLKALGCSAKEALAMSERWRPWRAYATRYLWLSMASPSGKLKVIEKGKLL